MTQTRDCPECGAELTGDAPEGLCPRCLLAGGSSTTDLAEFGPGCDGVAPSPAELARYFPQLEILGLRGRGGMGAVYKARQPHLDRLVALKILPPESATDLAFAERFAREARLLARLDHPNIVHVHDFGCVFPPSPEGPSTGSRPSPSPSTEEGWGGGGLYYFLMEFVDGVNLRQLLREGQMKPEEALRLIPQICEALQYAHEAGIIHRDIKPENILVNKKGRVKIADFGLAKLVGGELSVIEQRALTGAGQVMGTPNYMAPEQMEKPLTVDHRADIYSLGVVFYELLTGELPLGKFPPPSQKVSIDNRLDEVVMRTLERDPDRRFQHVSEIKTQIDSISLGIAQPEETEAGVRYIDLPLGLLALAGIALGMGGLALGIWLTGSILFLLGLPAIAKIGRLIPWRERDQLVAGVVLGLSGLAVVIFGLALSPKYWWVLLLAGPWFLAELYPMFGKDEAEEGEEEEEEADEEESDEEEEDEDEEEADAEASPVLGLSDQESKLLRFLKRFKSEDELQVLPEIDPDTLHQSRQVCQVPPGERVLALLDYTGGWDAGAQALVFGASGLHFHVQHEKQTLTRSIPYAEFPQRVFINHGMEVYIGDGTLPVSEYGETITGEALASILNGIKQLVQAREA